MSLSILISLKIAGHFHNRPSIGALVCGLVLLFGAPRALALVPDFGSSVLFSNALSMLGGLGDLQMPLVERATRPSLEELQKELSELPEKTTAKKELVQQIYRRTILLMEIRTESCRSRFSVATNRVGKPANYGSAEAFAEWIDFSKTARNEIKGLFTDLDRLKAQAQSLAIQCSHFETRGLEATNWANATVGELITPIKRICRLFEEGLVELEDCSQMAISRMEKLGPLVDQDPVLIERVGGAERMLSAICGAMPIHVITIRQTAEKHWKEAESEVPRQ